MRCGRLDVVQEDSLKARRERVLSNRNAGTSGTDGAYGGLDTGGEQHAHCHALNIMRPIADYASLIHCFCVSRVCTPPFIRVGHVQARLICLQES